MTANDVVKVIKACKEADIAELAWGELVVKFASSNCVQEKSTQDTEVDFVRVNGDSRTEEPPFSHDVPLFTGTEQSAEELDELENEQDLVLSDPLLFEQNVFENLQAKA